MKRKQSLTLDAAVWIVLMILAAVIAFSLLRRDKERHFGAVTFGSFPEFRLKTSEAELFDRRQIKGYVWAVHRSSSTPDAMSMAARIEIVQKLTASGKRHLNILTFLSAKAPVVSRLNAFHYIVVADRSQIEPIFSSVGNFGDNTVFLIDQNGVIRGKYDFGNVDEYRGFQRDLLRIL